jgi:tetratricopeptide (TPR) repeat protein/predicted Ser/Thr protein kinase
MDHESPIAGRFEILGLGGSGGMGAVLRAKDLFTGSIAALKIMRRKDAKASFTEEAQILSDLRHPGIVRYIAHGETASGEPYLAMEWLEGEDLSERLTREGLTAGESVELVRRAAEALQCAHSAGVVHRDIKPSNLFLCEGRIDRVKLLDFGIARRRGSPAGALTRKGVVLGTPGYMSPEQAMNGSIDVRSDIFSLGCVLFECLTGEPPFFAEDVMALLAKILLQEAPRLGEVRADLDPVLDDIVAQMLAKEPARRFPTAAAVAEALGTLDPSGAAPPGSVRHPPAEIGASEQGLLCVVLVSGERPGSDAPRSSSRLLSLPPGIEGAVARSGGRVERLLNGSIIATITGREVASKAAGSAAATDLATRAARCALAMKEAIPDMPMALAMGRGVLTKGAPIGEVIDRAARVLRTGISGLLEDPTLVLGETSPSPSVLERTSSEGDMPVFLDRVSAALLEARFDVRHGPAGPELHAERAEAEVTRTLLGKPTPCVGRDEELRTLLSAFVACVRGPESRAVLLVGDAGSGKSRVREELLRAVARSGGRASVLLGYGDPMSAGSPFGMLASAIRGLCGIKAGEPPLEARRKLGARLAKSLEGPALDHAEVFLSELLSIPIEGDPSVELKAALDDPRLMGDQMREAWQAWMTAECSRNPVVIVLEDLHWGDRPSVAFIEASLLAARREPLFVLATARPSIADLFPGLWAERGVLEMRLRELSESASEDLVREALGPEASPERVLEITSHAAGNPLYLEELIRAAANPRRGSLPATVLAMVQARLLDLEPEARRVLRAASIFGQIFWRAGVTALLGGTHRTGEVGEELAGMVERELCVRRGQPRLAGEEEYAFRHTLVREAAYTTLTDKDRALGHKLAGAWLERAGERDAMVLAEHFERGRAPEKALFWYRRAAEQALEGGDFSAAFERAERAIACGAAGEELGTLHLLAAYAHQWQGRQDDAKRSAREAMAHLPKGSDPWYRAAGEVVIAAGRLGAHDKLLSLGAEMLEVSRSSPVGAAALLALSDASLQLSIAGHLELALTIRVRVELAAAERAPLPPDVGARINKARAYHAYFVEGDLEAFLDLMAEVVAGYERAGDRRNACSAGSDLGFANLAVGAYAEAAAVLRKVLETADRMGLVTAAASARQNLGMVLARLGELAEARLLEEQAILSFSAQRDRRMEGGARIYLAVIHLESGDLERAAEEAKAAIDVMQTAPSMRIHAFATLAAVRLSEGRIDEALALVRAMMASLEEQTASLESLGDSADAESFIRLAHAEVLRAAGEVEASREAIRAARERLLARAGHFRREALRDQFLRAVPENARTLELARAWLDEPAG